VNRDHHQKLMDRRTFLKASSVNSVAVAAALNTLTATSSLASSSSKPAEHKKYQIGAYYAPIWHPDPWSEEIHGKGWTEWQVLKRAEPKYPGHQQPRVPLWGYEDESDPAVMARKIDAAADHGIDHFIMDWYWYEDIGSFQNRALDVGYMKAKNNSRLKFCLMWANHPRMDFHPVKRKCGMIVHAPGEVDRKTFDKITDHIIEKYFTHPCYWKIDGCPYMSIYQIMTLVKGLGGEGPAQKAIESFRAKTQAAGFADLHLAACASEREILYGDTQIGDEKMPSATQFIKRMGINSVATYVWVHYLGLPNFPTSPYDKAAAEAEKNWYDRDTKYGVAYHPDVTMGWDVSPRACQSDVYDNSGYPFMPAMEGNTPEAFKHALERAKVFVDQQKHGQRIVNINAWNEWNEGSYLEPDTVNGMGYLEAIRNVFGCTSS
jgi:hypothetical protein